MLKPRYMQVEAADAVFGYWEEEPGNPLVDVATGVGKSLILTILIQRLIEGWSGMRIVVATHVAELIEQSYLELLGAWPFAPAGILSAGLNRRDYISQILFAGIQTAWNKTDRIGHVDVLFVDEAHLIPEDGATMYGKFIAALRLTNPDIKIVGLTATPFRLKSGRLDEGDDRLFDKVVYTYGIADGVRDGYLAPLSSKGTETEFSYAGVAKLGGDYKQSALQAAFDKHDITKAAVEEIVRKGHNRRSWLCFCSGVEHALHVRDEIRSHGITCETVTGDTPKEERRRILEDFKNYRIRAVTNNSVLTTGFNHKGVDLIAAMRGTLSASLYVQMMGRGTRPLYAPGTDMETIEGRLAGIASGPKPNCLVLDFAGLVDEHGPVDKVQPRTPGKGDGEAPIKLCPECEEKCHASARKCPCCGFEFPESETPKHRASSSDAPILSTDNPWRAVTGRRFSEHQSKDPAKPNSVLVNYMLGYVAQKDWICPGHTGYAKVKSDKYWRAHGGLSPFPSSVEEFLRRADELAITAEIRLKQNGKYQNVEDFRSGAANDNTVQAANDDVPLQRYRTVGEDLDDDIPF